MLERDEALAYLSSFELDPTLLGRRISAGRQHTIFLYDDQYVLKLPNHSLYMSVYGAFTHAIVQRDVDVLNRYLPEHIPRTTVLRSTCDADDYAVLQDYLPTARFLSGADYDAYPTIREQFARIATVNRQLNDDHRLSLDFFGNQSFRQSLLAAALKQRRRALLNNLLIVEQPQPRILITDVNLSELRLGWTPDVNAAHWLIDRGLFLLSRWMLRRLFEVKV
jgi:hypothetical protein